MKAKSTYTLSKLDARNRRRRQGDVPPAKRRQPSRERGQAGGCADAAADATPPKPVAKSTAQKWATQTKPQPDARDRRADAGARATRRHAGAAAARRGGYNIDEIREISRGFFGTISTELGSVIEYAFSSAGRPDGYVLGTEGGGAFLAGVRYGSGKLYMRSGGSSESTGTGRRSAPTSAPRARAPCS